MLTKEQITKLLESNDRAVGRALLFFALTATAVV